MVIMDLHDTYILQYLAQHCQYQISERLSRNFGFEREYTDCAKIGAYLFLHFEILNRNGDFFSNSHGQHSLFNGYSYSFPMVAGKRTVRFHHANKAPMLEHDHIKKNFQLIEIEEELLWDQYACFVILYRLLKQYNFSDAIIKLKNILGDDLQNWAPGISPQFYGPLINRRRHLKDFLTNQLFDYGLSEISSVCSFKIIHDPNKLEKAYLPKTILSDLGETGWLPRNDYFFNVGKINGLTKYVILTDLLELASSAQMKLEKSGVQDLNWLSWYNNSRELPKLDWSLLRSFRVYYLLREHSGYDIRQTCETAEQVMQKLDEVGIQVKFLSYINGYWQRLKGEVIHRSFPELLTIREFQQRREKPAEILGYDAYCKNINILRRGRNELFSPIIRERSITVIRGDDSAFWFAIFLMFHLCLGKNMVRGWNFKKPIMRSIFLYNESLRYASIIEQLETVRFQRSGCPIDPYGIFSYEERERVIIDRIMSLDSESPKILFIDNSFNSGMSPVLINRLHQRNWSIVLINTQKQNSNIQDAESTVEVRRKEINKDKITVNVKVKSLFAESSNFICELDVKEYKARKIEKYKKKQTETQISRERLAEIIRFYFDRTNDKLKITGKALAIKYHTSESLIKKIKRELGLSKSRIPKQSRIQH